MTTARSHPLRIQRYSTKTIKKYEANSLVNFQYVFTRANENACSCSSQDRQDFTTPQTELVSRFSQSCLTEHRSIFGRVGLCPTIHHLSLSSEPERLVFLQSSRWQSETAPH
ncbi:unnamed protein product, partial [Ectocarpus sp. 12 AP-2014]